MVPEPNTVEPTVELPVEPDEAGDQIDVVSLEDKDQSELESIKSQTEDYDPPEPVKEDTAPLQEELAPQQEVITSPQHQERRLEDVCRVRDEAQSLRQEICKLRSRLEEVEEESKFHAAKANELTELLMNSSSCKGNSGIDDTILAQSEELAKRSRRIERLERKITKLTTEKAMLEIERDNAKKETAELSVVVRSLQNVTTISMDNNTNDNDDDGEDDDESEESEEVVLTPETALDLTLSNLKEHIEMLEDGLQTSSTLNSTQKKEIAALEMDNLLQQTKIGLLEELFRELNAHRLYEKEKERSSREVSEKKASDIKESDAREPSNDESEKEESNMKESDNDSTGSSLKSDSSSNIGKKFNLSSTQMTAFADKFRSIRTGTLAGLTAAIDKTGLSAALEPKEQKPAIPAAATAAAHAATLIVGKEEQTTSQNASSKPKATEGKKIKKVKIKFKKAGLEGTYTGPLVNKKPHGVGTIRFTNGNTYLGEMTRGKMSGTGTLYTKDNGVFRGRFENNKFVGELQSNDDDSSGNGDNPAHEDLKDDATAKTAATEEEEIAKSNTVAALELDGFSPTTITGNKDIIVGIDDSFRSKPPDYYENESFAKEFSGSERSTTPDEDASLSSHSDIAGMNQPSQQTAF